MVTPTTRSISAILVNISCIIYIEFKATDYILVNVHLRALVHHQSDRVRQAVASPPHVPALVDHIDLCLHLARNSNFLKMQTLKGSIFLLLLEPAL